MPETITVSRLIPARAERIFAAWLDAEEHGKMTGSRATAGPDGTLSAADGYIRARTLESTPYSRIVQSWRTTHFPDGAPDSTLTVTLDEVEQGNTRVTLTHAGTPAGQRDEYAQGWEKYYFEPMSKYFGAPTSRLQAVGAAIEDAVAKTGEAVEQALDDAKEELDVTVKTARATAKRAVKVVTRVKKSAVAKARAMGKTVGTLLSRGKKPAAAKPARKAVTPTKAAKAARPARASATAKGRAKKPATPGKVAPRRAGGKAPPAKRLAPKRAPSAAGKGARRR